APLLYFALWGFGPKLSERSEFFCPPQSKVQKWAARRAAVVGAPSFGYFSWQDKKSDLPPGNPRQMPQPVRTLRQAQGERWIRISV
ncbi:MAG: hypothetical protein ACRCV9_17720, partial [Burkholderiaceae bacterium]